MEKEAICRDGGPVTWLTWLTIDTQSIFFDFKLHQIRFDIVPTITYLNERLLSCFEQATSYELF